MASTAIDEPAFIVPDDMPEAIGNNDSALSTPTSSLTSIRSSVWRYQVENGRTYHAMSSGKYAFPNDDAENDRLDVQHYVWVLTFHGELGASPKALGGAKRVLDVGTGTGIWAIEYADAHPESEVIGVDLSPIQPSMVPPNCSFETDDAEREWTWTRPFDLIFSRVMAGSFSDFEPFVTKAFNALEPGGYLEMQDLCMPYKCDDGTMPEGSYIRQLGELFAEASTKLGRPLTAAPGHKALLEKAGFVDVVEKRLKWPIGGWPRERHYKELGVWCRESLTSGMEGLTMALLTRALGWTGDEVQVFCAKVREELKANRVHAYMPIYVVYGRKPESATE